MRSIAGLLLWTAVVVGCRAAEAVEDPARESGLTDGSRDPGLLFTRVHVPAGGLQGIPLGDGRYVPMSVREFEEAILRASVTARSGGRPTDEPSASIPPLQPLATSARYSATVRENGGLSGTLVFDVGRNPFADGAVAPRMREMPLGRLAVRSATVRTAAGTGDALVFGRPGGGLAVATPDAGTYSCEFACPPGKGRGESAFTLPLVPALFSSISLRLPAGTRPLLSGAASAAGAIVVPVAIAGRQGDDAMNEWRIECGPLAEIECTLVAQRLRPPPVSLWTEVDIRGRQARLDVTVQPCGPWHDGEVVLEKSPALVVAAAGTLGRGNQRRESAGAGVDEEVAWSVAEKGDVLRLFVPQTCIGHVTPLFVQAFGPIGSSGGAPPRPESLPLLRPTRDLWAGGGVMLQADPSLSLAEIELSDCLPVTPEVASRWPLPSAGDGESAGFFRVLPLRVPLELQGPEASVKLVVQPRVAELDVAKVTTVDVSPGVVLGRTACDVRVSRGEAFELTARMAAGWFIDSVEAIEWPGTQEWQEGQPPRNLAVSSHALDWKVVRDGRGNVLRIGLTVAATPARGLGLRITGHRAGVAVGASFSSADMEMVRLEGEAADRSIIEFRTNSDSMVDIDGDDVPAGPLEARLSVLTEEGAVRGRVRAGPQATPREVRLVRRRPPLEARTEVRLSVREDRLAESFTFACIPERSEIDAVVVHFSEPTDDQLEWSLLPPAGGTIAARRLDPAGARRGDAARGPAAAESWIVAFNPPVRDPVTIRAVRTTPFLAALPVPLAWIEGASTQDGEVIVKAAGRRRPRILNGRLPELPPGPVDADQSLSTVAEFSFDAARDCPGGGPPAAELAPGDEGEALEARAWAWREITSSWCHASGMTEYETLFEIENHGRSTVALGLAAGKRLQGVLVDGVGLPLTGRDEDVGTITVELPAGRRFVSLLVRSLAARNPVMGGWPIDSVGAVIDVPVLEREWRVLLPPALEVAVASTGHRAVGRDAGDWATRLFGARFRPAWSSSATGPDDAAVKPQAATSVGAVSQGFSERLHVSASGQRGGGELVVVQSRLLTVAAVVAAVLTGVVVWRLLGVRPAWALATCVAAACLALWAAPPVDAIARAAWWGAIAAAWLGSVRAGGRSATAAAAVVIAACGLPGPARAEPPPTAESVLRVFITPVDGGETALVPEQLFRLLTRAQPVDAAATVRVIGSRLRAPRGPSGMPSEERGRWRLELDVDADSGGTIVLDQFGCGARWVDGSVRIDGVVTPVRMDGDGDRLRLVVNASGRRRIDVEIDAAVSRRGDVETVSACIPAAPTAVLEAVASAADGSLARTDPRPTVVCEVSSADAPFAAVPASAGGGEEIAFDVSRATRVRLVRSLDPRARLADGVRSAESRNDVSWQLDGCTVKATYEIDPGEEILRSVVVEADHGLEPIMPDRSASDVAGITAADVGLDIRPLGGRRWLVERRTPTAGRASIELPFRMPLADPAGSFSVPGVWLGDAAVDVRTTRLTASRDLEVAVVPPEGAMPAVPRDTEAGAASHAWRIETVRTAAGAGNGRQAGVIVKRRQQAVRGSQNLSVAFGVEQMRLHLEARIDASSTSLFTIPMSVPAGCEIEQLRLFEDDALSPETAERGAIDVRWRETSPGRIVAVVQRPRAGLFRLDVAARMRIKAGAGGQIPLLKADLDAGTPLLVTWRGSEGIGVAVTQPDGTPADRVVEVAPGQSPPLYVVEEEPPPARVEAVDPDVSRAGEVGPEDAAPPVPLQPRVELADIQLVVGERGRAWGLARFDLVAAEPVVRIELPAGLRLFELLVDGRPAENTAPVLPERGNVWEVRLLDIRWPRSVQAVFAGEIGGRLAAGGPFEVPAPAIIGLPCSRTLWTLEAPESMTIEVAAPARVLDESGMDARRRESMRRLEGDFERALAACGRGSRPRLEEVLRLRREGLPPPLEPAWNRLWERRDEARPPASRSTVSAVTDGDRPLLTVQVVRRPDPTTRSRAVAMLAVLSLGALTWAIAARGRGAWSWWPRVAGPLLPVVPAVAWLAAFTPAWPGWLLLACAAWMTAVARAGRHRGHPSRGQATDDEASLTRVAAGPATGPAAADRGSESTATFLAP